MKRRKEWLWWEPHWSFRPKLRKVFEPFLNPWLWLRMELAAVVLLGFVFWLAGRFPEIELPMERIALLALILPPAILGTPLLMYWWLPPFVSISRKGILIMHGQISRWLLAKRIQTVQLLLQVPAHPLIRVTTTEATETYGIAAKVNLADLEAFIREVLPEVKCERVAA